MTGLLAMNEPITNPMRRLLEAMPAFRNSESGIRNLKR